MSCLRPGESRELPLLRDVRRRARSGRRARARGAEGRDDPLHRPRRLDARAEGLDPEDVRATLSAYYAQLRAELERHGGTVEKFIGDAVMAVFGAPVAHEDDPERAVRAALAIRDSIGEELQIRTAVNTGEALVALGAKPGEGDAMVAGDVVNTAARLQSAAPVNGILVGEGTYRATRHAIDYREAPPVEAKGKSEPVKVWEAVGARLALRQRRGAEAADAARRPRARARPARRRIRARAQGAVGPARHARRRARESARAGSSPSCSRSPTRTRRSSPGDRVALSPTASGPASGRSARSSRPMPGFSSPTTPRRRRRSSSRWSRRSGRTSGSGTGSPATRARSSVSKIAGQARSRRGVRRLAPTTRGCGRAAPAHTRLRGPPLGRRRPARLRRPPRRLGDDRSAPDRRNRAARAARPPSRLGRRQAQRLHALDRRAVGRGDRPAPAAPARPRRPRRRRSAGACCSARRATRSTRRSTRGCSPSTTAATCRCPRRCRA